MSNVVSRAAHALLGKTFEAPVLARHALQPVLLDEVCLHLHNLKPQHVGGVRPVIQALTEAFLRHLRHSSSAASAPPPASLQQLAAGSEGLLPKQSS